MPGDRWIEVDDFAAAAEALGDMPRRVFLGIGRTQLAPFAGHPQHFYLVRLVDPPRAPLPLTGRSHHRARTVPTSPETAPC